MCVCVTMPTHCTITRFGFRGGRIDGVERGLFSNHASLEQTTLGGTSIYIVYRRKLKLAYCMCSCLWDGDERKGEGETRCRLITCSSRKAPRGPLGLTCPSDGRIAVNSIICLLNIYTAERFGI